LKTKPTTSRNSSARIWTSIGQKVGGLPHDRKQPTHKFLLLW
jgi:hypothetical protein